MSRRELFEQALKRLGASQCEPLSRHTFVQVGGVADWLLRVRHRAALIEAIQLAREARVSLTVLGAGSNVLVRDSGIRGLVLLNESRGCQLDAEGRITVDSGTRFATLARATARDGLSGLEWSAGIPGAIGGGLATNAGAYGSSLADRLVSVRAITPNGDELELEASELQLSYRDSSLRSGDLAGLIVIDLTLQLQPGNPAAALAEIERVEALRKRNAPSGPSLGSTFRNPACGEHTAGQLIDLAGLKGRRVGAAQVSELHGNYLLNTDVRRARAADFLQLIAEIQEAVNSQFGLQLVPEIALVGSEARDDG